MAEEANVTPDVTGPDKPIESTEEGKKFAGKYSSPEELEKGYLELQKLYNERVGGQDDNNQNNEPDQNKTRTEDNNTDNNEQNEEPQYADAEEKDVANFLSNVGLDYNEIHEEVTNNGQLSEETYQKLAEKGLSKNVVDSYIAGRQSKVSSESQEVDQFTSQMIELVGGEESFNQMADWASQSLSEQELNDYNEAVSSGDPFKAHKAVMDLQGKYEKAFGKSPNLVRGNKSKSTQPQGFKSNAELVRAMQDARYKTDPAYRQEVQQKLANSELFG